MENTESQTKHWTKKTIMWAIGKKEKCVVRESIGNDTWKIVGLVLQESCKLECVAKIYKE